jgi:hypothetical protein
MGTRQEKEQLKQWWYQQRRHAWKKMRDEKKLPFCTPINLPQIYAENTEERNDVYLYRTLRYPPFCTPPQTE